MRQGAAPLVRLAFDMEQSDTMKLLSSFIKAALLPRLRVPKYPMPKIIEAKHVERVRQAWFPGAAKALPGSA